MGLFLLFVLRHGLRARPSDGDDAERRQLADDAHLLDELHSAVKLVVLDHNIGAPLNTTRASVCSLCNYQTYILFHLQQLNVIDSHIISDEARRDRGEISPRSSRDRAEISRRDLAEV